MVLERFLMKLFCPRRLARRDIERVWQAISTASTHCEQGAGIQMATCIPEHDLYHLLGLMESNGYIERDPGPRDEPWTHDRMLAWWAPGRSWYELTVFYGSRL